MAKKAKSRFVPPFGGLRGNVHGSWLVGEVINKANAAHAWSTFCQCQLNFFRQLLRLRRYERIFVEIVVGWSPTNDCWRQITRVPGLSRGVVSVILRFAVLTQYRRVTDRYTDRHSHRYTDTTTANTR